MSYAPIDSERCESLTSPTLKPDVLQVASAFPDPPFELTRDGMATGFDIDLLQQVCDDLGLRRESVRYTGADFDGIFAGLAEGRYDAVISGTTITPYREQLARFSVPYGEFNQGLIVNVTRTPQITSVAGLRGEAVGVQSGNTSQIIARNLLAEGAIARIAYYPYDGIGAALDDLVAGKIGAVIKLHPVAAWLVRDRPQLAVVAQIPTHERLGIAVALGNVALGEAINASLSRLKADGRFATLARTWFGAQGEE